MVTGVIDASELRKASRLTVGDVIVAYSGLYIILTKRTVRKRNRMHSFIGVEVINLETFEPAHLHLGPTRMVALVGHVDLGGMRCLTETPGSTN